MLLLALLWIVGQSDPKPTAPMTAWVTPEDYPVEAIRAEQEGTVHFRLEIDERGIPSDCTVTTSSGHQPLDTATCQIMHSRTRFHPARDKNGRAIASSYTSRIRWILPEEQADINLLEEFKPALLKVGLNISQDGRILSCTRDVQGQPIAMLDALSCDGLTADVPRLMPSHYGPTYRTITYAVSISVDAKRYPIEVGALETVLMRRTTEIALTDQGTALSCQTTAEVGMTSVMPFQCEQSEPTDTELPPAHRIIVDVAMLGTPR